MKKILLALFGVYVAVLPVQAEDLTPCGALLCLQGKSTGHNPSECSPYLNAYYSITRKHWSDTWDARRAWLNTCPAVKDGSISQNTVESSMSGEYLLGQINDTKRQISSLDARISTLEKRSVSTARLYGGASKDDAMNRASLRAQSRSQLALAKARRAELKARLATLEQRHKRLTKDFWVDDGVN